LGIKKPKSWLTIDASRSAFELTASHMPEGGPRYTITHDGRIK